MLNNWTCSKEVGSCDITKAKNLNGLFLQLLLGFHHSWRTELWVFKLHATSNLFLYFGSFGFLWHVPVKGVYRIMTA